MRTGSALQTRASGDGRSASTDSGKADQHGSPPAPADRFRRAGGPKGPSRRSARRDRTSWYRPAASWETARKISRPLSQTGSQDRSARSGPRAARACGSCRRMSGAVRSWRSPSAAGRYQDVLSRRAILRDGLSVLLLAKRSAGAGGLPCWSALPESCWHCGHRARVLRCRSSLRSPAASPSRF